MARKAKVHLIIASSGQYDDYRTWPIAAFAHTSAATTEVQRLNSLAARYRSRLDAAWEKHADAVRDEASDATVENFYDRARAIQRSLEKTFGDLAQRDIKVHVEVVPFVPNPAAGGRDDASG